MTNKKTKNTGATSVSAKAKKLVKGNKKAKAAVEVDVPVIEQTEEVVLDAPSDLTATVPEAANCTVCDVAAQTDEDGNVTNFSRLTATGKLRTICKPCQTVKSVEWTTKRADYRKEYARANFYQQRGIPALMPTASAWKAGDVIMTVEYSLLDGKRFDADGNRVTTDTPNAVTFPSRIAEEVYQEQLATRVAEREAVKAANQLLLDEAKAERAELRQAEKAERDAKKAEAADVLKAQRQAEREQKAEERAQKALETKAEKDEAREAKLKQRADDALAKAEAIREATANKAIERAEASKQKAIDKATAVAEKRQQAVRAANEKAIAALKS